MVPWARRVYIGQAWPSESLGHYETVLSMGMVVIDENNTSPIFTVNPGKTPQIPLLQNSVFTINIHKYNVSLKCSLIAAHIHGVNSNSFCYYGNTAAPHNHITQYHDDWGLMRPGRMSHKVFTVLGDLMVVVSGVRARIISQSTPPHSNTSCFEK